MKNNLAENYSVYLIGFMRNMASPIERTPLNHSYGYDPTGVSPICFAIFPGRQTALKSDPFKDYPG
jgi:hypothetical protein